MSMAEKMTDPLAQTVAQVLASELADPEAIAALIRETEAELASLEAKQADAEPRVLSPAGRPTALAPRLLSCPRPCWRGRRSWATWPGRPRRPTFAKRPGFAGRDLSLRTPRGWTQP
jgi:hypothetical protein